MILPVGENGYRKETLVLRLFQLLAIPLQEIYNQRLEFQLVLSDVIGVVQQQQTG